MLSLIYALKRAKLYGEEFDCKSLVLSSLFSLPIKCGYSDNGNLWNPAQNPIVQGSLSSQTGGESDSTTRLRCEGYIKVEPNTAYTFESNVPRVFIIEYGEINTKPIDSSGWVTMPKTLTTSENTNYIRFTLAATGNAAITVDDFEWLKIEKATVASATFVLRRPTEEIVDEEFGDEPHEEEMQENSTYNEGTDESLE